MLRLESKGTQVKKETPHLARAALLLVVLAAVVNSGCVGVAGSSSAAPPGGLNANPSSVNFGNVTVGSTNTQTVTLYNAGSSSLTISQANVTGTGFSISGLTLPRALGPGQNTTFTVAFAPSAVGSASGSVSVVSNAPNSPTVISLTGSGVQSAAHSVDLLWDASTSLVTGYNVYRGTQSGGPYTKVNSSAVGGTTYTDSTVQGGQTYFYVVTSLDVNAVESIFSNEAQAAVPFP